MPEGSIKGPIDREAEIEVKIKQARLKVERSYKSTLDILSNDLKNTKEELAQRDAIFEVRDHSNLIRRLGHCHRRYGATGRGV